MRPSGGPLPADRGAGTPSGDVMDAVPAIVWEADAIGQRMTYVSPRALDLLGHDPEEWLVTPGFWETHVHPDDLGRASRAIDDALAAASPIRVQYRFRAAGGAYRLIQDSIQVVVTDADGRRLVGVMVDVTDEEAPPEHAPPGRSGAAGARPLHEAIVDNMSDGVYYVDTDRRITYWNRGAQRLTGYRSSEVIGRPCHDNILSHVDGDGRNLCMTACPLSAALLDGQVHEALVWLRHANGSRRPVQVRVAPIRSDDGAEIVGAVETFSDATGLIDAQSAAERFRQDALTDPLTGLANRRLLDAVLASRQDDLDGSGLPFGLLMLDIDHFKQFNDTYGHDVGDAALRVVADTLMGAVRGGDVVVRWGGEEFAIVAAQVDAQGLARLGERVLTLVRTAQVRAGHAAVPVRLSIGGTLACAGEPVEALFSRADGALLVAKDAGRDCFVFGEASSTTP